MASYLLFFILFLSSNWIICSCIWSDIEPFQWISHFTSNIYIIWCVLKSCYLFWNSHVVILFSSPHWAFLSKLSLILLSDKKFKACHTSVLGYLIWFPLLCIFVWFFIFLHSRCRCLHVRQSWLLSQFSQRGNPYHKAHPETSRLLHQILPCLGRSRLVFAHISTLTNCGVPTVFPSPHHPLCSHRQLNHAVAPQQQLMIASQHSSPTEILSPRSYCTGFTNFFLSFFRISLDKEISFWL